MHPADAPTACYARSLITQMLVLLHSAYGMRACWAGLGPVPFVDYSSTLPFKGCSMLAMWPRPLAATDAASATGCAKVTNAAG